MVLKIHLPGVLTWTCAASSLRECTSNNTGWNSRDLAEGRWSGSWLRHFRIKSFCRSSSSWSIVRWIASSVTAPLPSTDNGLTPPTPIWAEFSNEVKIHELMAPGQKSIHGPHVCTLKRPIWYPQGKHARTNPYYLTFAGSIRRRRSSLYIKSRSF